MANTIKRRGKRDSMKGKSKSGDVKKIDIDLEKVSAVADAEVVEKVVQPLTETPTPAEDDKEDATSPDEAPETKQNTPAAEDDAEKVSAVTHTEDVNDDEMRRLSFIGDLSTLGKEAEGDSDESSWTSSEASSLPDQEGEVMVADDENEHGNNQSVPGSEDDKPSSGDVNYVEPSQAPSMSKVEESSFVDDKRELGNEDKKGEDTSSLESRESGPGSEDDKPPSGDANYVQSSQAQSVSMVEETSFVDDKRELGNETKKGEDTSSLESRESKSGSGDDKPFSSDANYVEPSQAPSMSEAEESLFVMAADDKNEDGNYQSEPGSEDDKPSSGDANYYVQPSQAPSASKVEESSFVGGKRELGNEAKQGEDTSSLANGAEDAEGHRVTLPQKVDEVSVDNKGDGLGDQPKISRRGEYDSAQDSVKEKDASKAVHKEEVIVEYEIEDDEEQMPWTKRVAARLCCSKRLR